MVTEKLQIISYLPLSQAAKGNIFSEVTALLLPY